MVEAIDGHLIPRLHPTIRRVYVWISGADDVSGFIFTIFGKQQI